MVEKGIRSDLPERLQKKAGRKERPMDRLFNPENPFWSFMNKVMDVFMISILWFIFSIPIITIGASTTALFQFTLKLTADEEGYVCRSFIRAFFKNFVQATAAWAVVLVCGGFLAFDLYLSRRLPLMPVMQNGLFFAIISIMIVFLLTVLYVFPLLSFFHVKLKQLIGHAFIMAVGNLHVSIIIIAIYAAAGAAVLYLPMAFPVIFGIACFLSSYFYRLVFRKYIEDINEREE